MREIENILISDKRVNSELSLQYNQERRGLDNAWLFQKVQEGLMPQQAYLRLQIIRDMCEFVYPGLWDIQLEVWDIGIKVQYKPELIDLDAPVQQMGCYFGFERVEEGEQPDTYEYYLDNYENIHGEISYTQGQLHASEEPFYEIHRAIQTLAFNIIVKFPEVVVRTNTRLTQNVKDIFFKLIFKCPELIRLPYDTTLNRYTAPIAQLRVGDMLHFTHMGNDINYHFTEYYIPSSMESTRLTVSYIEFYKGYLHSHSGTRSGSTSDISSWTKWGQYCCLGTGEINNIFGMLRADFTPEMMTMLLLQIQGYAEWESQAGGPYIHISNLTGDVTREYNGVPNASNGENYFSYLKRVVKRNPERDSNIDTKIENKKLVIIDNDKFKNFCKTSDDPNDATYGVTDVLYEAGDGKYISAKPASNASTNRQYPTEEVCRRSPLFFQGENHYFQVLRDQDLVVDSTQPFILNPKIVNYIKSKLESHANFKRYKDDILDRINQVSNNSTNIRQNQIPMPAHT